MTGFSAVGAGPIGATSEAGAGDDRIVLAEAVALTDALDGLVTLTIGDGIGMGTVLEGDSRIIMAQGLGFAAVPTATLIQRLIEALHLTGTPALSLDVAARLTDEAAFGEAMVLIWQALASEQVELTGTALGRPILIAALVDHLHATGAVATRVDAMAVVASAIAINGMLAGGWMAEAIDTVAFQDALASQLRALATLMDTAGFTDTSGPAMRITAVMADTVALALDPSATLEAFARLSEEVALYTVIRVGEAEFAGWVLSQGAAWQYRNYPFNGFAAVGTEGGRARYFGTSDTGLYELVGDDDAGEPIEARILTALQDFGTGKRKRVPDVYIAFAGGDKVVLRVTTTGRRGERRTDVYVGSVPAGDDLHNARLKVGRGLESRYWQFEITNVGPDGTVHDVGAIDDLQFRPLVLDRRI